MKKYLTAFFSIALLWGALHFETASATTIVGVNVVAVAQSSDQTQDELIAELQKDGVTVIRTALGGRNDGYTSFIIKAWQHGIGAIVMVDPNSGGTGLHTSKYDPAAGRRWAMPALSAPFNQSSPRGRLVYRGTTLFQLWPDDVRSL